MEMTPANYSRREFLTTIITAGLAAASTPPTTLLSQENQKISGGSDLIQRTLALYDGLKPKLEDISPELHKEVFGWTADTNYKRAKLDDGTLVDISQFKQEQSPNRYIVEINFEMSPSEKEGPDGNFDQRDDDYTRQIWLNVEERNGGYAVVGVSEKLISTRGAPEKQEYTNHRTSFTQQEDGLKVSIGWTSQSIVIPNAKVPPAYTKFANLVIKDYLK